MLQGSVSLCNESRAERFNLSEYYANLVDDIFLNGTRSKLHFHSSDKKIVVVFIEVV